jgi:hypothetical protein
MKMTSLPSAKVARGAAPPGAACQRLVDKDYAAGANTEAMLELLRGGGSCCGADAADAVAAGPLGGVDQTLLFRDKGRSSVDYDAFGDIGTIFRDLDWKTQSIPGEWYRKLQSHRSGDCRVRLALAGPGYTSKYCLPGVCTCDHHPSLAGAYLNSLVVYATIFGKSPIGAAWPDGQVPCPSPSPRRHWPLCKTLPLGAGPADGVNGPRKGEGHRGVSAR